MTSPPSPPDPTWRAVEAVVLAGFAYAVGFGLPLAVVVGLLALGVSAAELVGYRYGYPVVFRDLSLCLVLLVFAALAVSRGARWFPVVATPVTAWFALDALARVRDDGTADGDPSPDAGFEDADLAGELLRALRDDPRRPDELAADLDLRTARAARALDALVEAGTVERDERGRYRVARDAGGPSITALPGRLYERVLRPIRALA